MELLWSPGVLCAQYNPGLFVYSPKTNTVSAVFTEVCRRGRVSCKRGDAVASAREAVAKAAELKPDIIILDLAMPLMDGLHAAQTISAASPTIPIFMHTMHN